MRLYIIAEIARPACILHHHVYHHAPAVNISAMLYAFLPTYIMYVLESEVTK